jgi:GTP-binding protein
MSAPATTGVPTIAIVGRPNVGKSTLFNRIVGSRRAIVGDEPGITRDRLYGEAHFRGHRLRIVDTGGIEPDEKDLIPAEIFRQAKVALAEADAIILVVDGRSELTAPDLDVARLLLRGGKPLFLAVNKIDSVKQQSLTDEFRRLGIRKIFPVSAEHGRGVDDVLEAVFEALKLETASVETAEPEIVGTGEETEDAPETEIAPESKEVKVAIIGHPNVGKSTLLNRLTGTSRAIVSPIPGTTRDAVDEVVEINGKDFRFIDTAGIRRKGKTHLMAEKLSVVMARKHLDAADIALLVIDATEGVSALDRGLCPRERPIRDRHREQMGPGYNWSEEGWPRDESDAHSRESDPDRSRGIRRKSPLRPQVLKLRARALRLRRHRERCGEDLSYVGRSRSRTTEAHSDSRDEPIPQIH